MQVCQWLARATLVMLVLAAVAPATYAEDAQTATPAPSARPGSLFDPARHMRLAEVKPGMKGHGLSVFQGTKIERFEVEVVSILKNFNPRYDVVLIRCKGANLEHTGSIAGMSGSPVYLKDDAGRERMIGAFAWGWPLAKDPVAGVTPIEYMLELADGSDKSRTAGGPATQPAGATGGPAGAAAPAPRMQWKLADVPADWQPGWMREAVPLNQQPPVAHGLHAADAARLRPLAVPLMVSGVSPKLMDRYAADFGSAGLVPLQAGGSGAEPDDAAKLEPGSAMVITLLTGDADLNAVGTCTEVIGDRVFGFGHPFNNEGAVLLPMGAGKINGVIANLTTSFKLGTLTKPMGRVTTDQLAGVAGKLGDAPPMIPIELDVSYTDHSQPARSYRFQSAAHPRFTPLLGGLAFGAAVAGASDLPQYNTVKYDVTLDFANGQKVRVADAAVNADPRLMFMNMGLAMMAAGENPFERVGVTKISGAVKVTPEARHAQIVEVHVPRSKYKPGETVKAFVTYKPFRAPEATLDVQMELPRDLPQGQYNLVISDADRYLQDEAATRPFRFTAEKVTEVFDVVRDVTAVRHDALYVRLIRQSDGIAQGRTALPQLPSSRRQIMLGAGRSNTTAFVSSTVKVLPTDRVMTGSGEFQIQIETPTKVEPGPGAGASAGGPASRPAQARPRSEETKPKRPKKPDVESDPK